MLLLEESNSPVGQENDGLLDAVLVVQVVTEFKEGLETKVDVDDDEEGDMLDK